MSTDLVLVQAYLENMQMALHNLDVQHAETLLESVQKLFLSSDTTLTCSPPMHISVGVGLDTGVHRKGKPNEDFAFATTGLNIQTQETYGLFIIADGMGGHANGRLASSLAVETIVNTLLPFLHHEQVRCSELGDLLVSAVTYANNLIFARNREVAISSPLGQMGTTVTAGVVFGPHAFVVNVGDSRTYLYRPGVGLRAVTHDHSRVADMVVRGELAPEAVYTHPERNKIYRSVGATLAVKVDLFYEQLQDGDILMFCSDGVWEMTRDEQIEQILAAPLSADSMAEHLMHLAIQGGGVDNIGLVVSQFQMNVAGMQTVEISPLSVAIAS
jgi:serine/threonine protein phosphatase PrpC